MGLDGGHGMWDQEFTDNDELVGDVSGRRIPYDGVVNLSAANDFADFRGTIGGEVQGFALVTDEGNLELEFQVVGGRAGRHLPRRSCRNSELDSCLRDGHTRPTGLQR